MRLIDADKLVEICRKGWKLFGRDNEKLKHWVDENDIRGQPTVKAIPISELRRWLNKQDMPYKDYVIGVIEYAINAWEIENEID